MKTKLSAPKNFTVPDGAYGNPTGQATIQQRQKIARSEAEARAACTYAAYGVPQGDAPALADAQRRKRPSLVPLRMNHGALELASIDSAVQAIVGGWAKLEI